MRTSGSDRRPSAVRRVGRPGVARKVLYGIELFTGVAGLAGGLLLAIAPDGSLMMADPAVLQGSPFRDWRIPGALLALLVGGGFLAVGWWQRRGGRYAAELSVLAGIGLIAFEVVEWAWIGFHPLQAVFGIVGVIVIYLAVAERRRLVR